MDISNWQIDKIMQLPDYCFGRRWMFGLGRQVTSAGAKFAISQTKLPDRFVIWEIKSMIKFQTSSSMVVVLKTGEQLPTSAAEFAEQKLLLPQIESTDGIQGGYDTMYLESGVIDNIKIPVENEGRYLIASFNRTVGAAVGGQVNLVISTIPSEVPDWLLKP